MPADSPRPKVVVVMPAYNAARTLVRTYRDIPKDVVDHMILVDDLSNDDTVAVPGVVTYLDGALDSGRVREADQRRLAAAVAEGAVVYGAYAPTLLFDTRLVTLTPWPSAGVNVRDPVGRLGVTHVLVGNGPADPTGQVPTIVEQGPIDVLARVPWGGQELALYALAPRAQVEVSPLTPPSGYDPGTVSPAPRR